jgi:hypothetical protein
MIAPARALRRLHCDGLKTVFIGPCIARKGEAAGPRAVGLSLGPGGARVFHILWITFPHGISDPPKHGF